MSALRDVIRRVLLVGIGVPSLLTAIFLGLQISWLPELPDQVAIHWSANGADGFGAPKTYILLNIFPVWLLPIVIAGLTVRPVMKRTITTFNLRFLVGTAVWTSAFLGLALTLSLEIQRGISDAKQAPGIGAQMLWSLAFASLFTAVVVLLLPAVRRNSAAGEELVSLKLKPSETVLWFKEIKMSRAARWGINATNIVMLAITLWCAATAQWVVFTILLISTVITVLATLSTTKFTVKIDETGLHAYPPLKFPRFEVGLAEIKSVAVRDVDVFAEFGGWGVRTNIKAMAVALKSGPALLIARKKKTDLVITMPDAKQAAEILQGILARSQDSR